jgi:hypothetical protein
MIAIATKVPSITPNAAVAVESFRELPKEFRIDGVNAFKKYSKVNPVFVIKLDFNRVNIGINWKLIPKIKRGSNANQGNTFL